MPRSSRHKSHRYHKHSARDAKERSDSEDDRNSRDRRLRLVEVGPVSGARASMDVEAEKRKASSSLQVSLEKDKGGAENGDFSSGRKRKEREEDSATPDRWNGNGKDDGFPGKGSKEEAFGHVNSEKMDKSRLLTAELKGRSSRRHDGSTERYVESGNRTELVKRRLEKEHTRGEYRDDKERGIDRLSEREKDRECVSEREKDRECVSERGKKVQDSRHGRSDDLESKSQRSRRGAVEVEWKAKKDSTESQARDDLHNAELEKDPEKLMTKRRCNSGGIDKGLDDGRNSDDRRLSSRDDHVKNGSHNVDAHKDERYRDRYYKDLDRDQRDQRHRDIRHREERSSRDYINDRLESKSVRDRDKHFESNKKSRLHGSDRELSPHADDHGIRSRGNRLRKRSYDEIDVHHGLRKINTKVSRSNVDKDASNSSKFDYGQQGKVGSSLNNIHSRSSLSPKVHNLKEQIRRGLKQAEYTHGEAACEDRACPTEDNDKISVVHERVSESLSSEKALRRDRVNSDNRERPLVFESPSMDNNSQAALQITERASASPSLFKRTSHFYGSSPGHLIPQPLMRHGMETSSINEDEMRVTSGDRRSNSWYRRSTDPNMERGQGGVWKNGPNWPAPLPNGFIPFQHGPPAPGFNIQHFPPPSLFGARPYMEMNQTGIPYHMHDVADRFASHVHPFGWHHPVDDSCPPQMNGWNGGNSPFGDKSQVYRGPDWNRNRHLVGGRGWELNSEMSKGQSSSMAEFSSPPDLTDESRVAYPILESNSKVEHFRHASDAADHPEQLNDSPDNKSKEARLETKLERDSHFKKKFNGDSLNLCNYLSKIEISADLIDPELYKKVNDLLASVNFTGICNVSKDEDAKNKKIQNYGKFSNLKVSMSPAAADASFKRAMSVYEKQSYKRQLKPPPVALEVTAEDEMRPSSSSSLPNQPISSAGDADSSLTHMEVKNVENHGENMKKQSDLNSDVDILESSQTCEAIMSVCKLNLIRIHNSTESTH